MTTDATPTLAKAAAAHRDAAAHVSAAYRHLATARAHQPQGHADPHDQQLQKLSTRLTTQRDHITATATRLHTSPPWLEPTHPADTPDLATAIAQAEHHLTQADAEIAAVERQTAPPLLPAASPTTRTVLVSAAWSLLGATLQCGLVVATNGTEVKAAVAALCFTPPLVFALALATLYIFGQPRTGARLKYNIRLAALICLIGMPAVWLALIVGLAALRA